MSRAWGCFPGIPPLVAEPKLPSVVALGGRLGRLSLMVGTMPNHVLRLGATAFALFLFISPARAVTCEEARGLSATELARWAERLQVSPPYLAALLERAFCESSVRRERALVPDSKRAPAKPLNRTSSLR